MNLILLQLRYTKPDRLPQSAQFGFERVTTYAQPGDIAWPLLAQVSRRLRPESQAANTDIAVVVTARWTSLPRPARTGSGRLHLNGTERT
jgi:hypothetical protein